MKHFTVYDPNTGGILRFGACPADMLAIQAQPGEVAIEGSFSDETHYIDAQHIVAIEKPAKPAGDYWFDLSTKSWVPIQRTKAELTATAMAKRSQLLAQCDWTQLPDVPLATKTAWVVYRQALRDISLQAGYPQTIAWPVQPT